MAASSFNKDPVIREFLRHIASVRGRIEQIILFGSRARGDEKPYSDYDILLVVPERKQDLVDAVHEAAMQVLFSTERLISLKIYPREQFQRLSSLPTPFLKNVMKEGVVLG